MKEDTKEYLIKEMGRVHEVFQVIDKYNPDLADAIAALRRVAIPSEGSGGFKIPTKYRELIMTAVEVATGRGERGRSHARKAIRAGATPAEVLEALALCVYLVGMSSWVDSGMECVLAAEEEDAKAKRGEAFYWTSEIPKKPEH
jgi:alkylhydroperoxidase/carboxymuconolactone decarboxylase family protein YurZ